MCLRYYVWKQAVCYPKDFNLHQIAAACLNERGAHAPNRVIVTWKARNPCGRRHSGVKMTNSAAVFASPVLVRFSAYATSNYWIGTKHCEAKWMLKIPPVYRQEAVSRYHRKTFLTGEPPCGRRVRRPNARRSRTPSRSLHRRGNGRHSKTAPQFADRCLRRTALSAEYGNRVGAM